MPLKKLLSSLIDHIPISRSIFSSTIGISTSRAYSSSSQKSPRFSNMGLVMEEAENSVLKSSGHHHHYETSHETRKFTPVHFAPRRVVVLSKTTRLEYEWLKTRKRIRDADFTDETFLKQLKKRNIDFVEMKKKHDLQVAYIDSIVSELKKDDIEVRVVTRSNYTKDLALWSDMIISAGGDGTFLTAASKVRNAIPVLGINTDPVGSEGHLCLTGKARRPANDVIRQFLNGQFNWMYRQRIRVTVIKPSPDDIEVFSESDGETIHPNKPCYFGSDDECDEPPAEPMIALNEVFIGESHAARVSYYEVQIDDGPLIKQKSSGMTVCTGTGSTSWHYNINRLTEQNLHEMLGLMSQMGYKVEGEINEQDIEEVCKRYNQNLIFEPDAEKMAFSVRDPVFNATFPKTASRGFCHKIRLKSRCSHAQVVLDSHLAIPFNNGAEVIIEMHPEDVLRTASLV